MTESQVLFQRQLQGATLLETMLAQAFVMKYPGRYDDYQFNFRIGAGTDPGNTLAPEIRRMGILLTQKRIDMVASKSGRFGLWELKARAGFASLGQLLGYAALWKIEGRQSEGLEVGIITRLVDADVEVAFRSHAVTLEIFDTPAITAAAIAQPIP